MKLWVYSSRDLDEMEAIIRDFQPQNVDLSTFTIKDLFSNVVNKHINLPSFNDPPAYSEENLGNFYRAKSVLDENELNICFWLPCYQKDYFYDAIYYPWHVLRHEGENSLISALIKLNFATDIYVSYDHMLGAFSYLDINITLTNKGFDNYESVIQIVWEKIRQMKEAGPQEYIFSEYDQNWKLQWRFYEKNDALWFVTSIAERMQIFEESDIGEILSSQFLYKGFDREGIQKVMDLLRPETCIINLYSQHHGVKLWDEDSEDEETESGEGEDSESDHGIDYVKEPVYGTKYAKDKFSTELLEKLKNPYIPEDWKLGDPPVNNLFPSNLEILEKKKNDLDIPEMIHTDKCMEIWYLKWVKFNTPTVYVIDSFYTNDCGILNTIEGKTFHCLWTRVIHEYFREYNYMAEQTSMSFCCGLDVDGMEFSFRGYTDKIEEFIYGWFTKLVNFDAGEHKHIFDMKRKEFIKDQKNFFYDDPNEQINSIFNKIIVPRRCNIRHYQHAAKKMTFGRFVELSKQLLKNGRHLWFCIGNLESKLSQLIFRRGCT
jgi:insulysin